MPVTSDSCPDLERLAALIDGRLASAERAALMEHLAGCRTCYEVFVDAAELHEELEAGEDLGDDRSPAGDTAELGNVRTFPWRRRWKWAVPAAALAAAAALAVVLIRPSLPRAPSLPALLGGLAEGGGSRLGDGWADLGWTSDFRGDDAVREEAQRDLRIGVRLVDLHVALKLGDLTVAGRLSAEVASLLEAVEHARPLVETYRFIVGEVATGETGDDLLEVSVETEDLVRRQLGPSPFFFLGEWAEAGRLAARAGDPAHFLRPDVRRSLSTLRKMELPSTVAEELRRVEELSTGEPDLKALEAILEEMVRLQPPDRNASRSSPHYERFFLT